MLIYDLPDWLAYWLLAALLLPTLPPVVLGIVCGLRMKRISVLLAGFLSSALGFILYVGWYIRIREKLFGYSHEVEALEAFGGLGLLSAAQVSCVSLFRVFRPAYSQTLGHRERRWLGF